VLVAHHATAQEIWLIIQKKHTAGRLTYVDALEEALCFADRRILKRIDDENTRSGSPRAQEQVSGRAEQEARRQAIQEGG